MASPARTTPRMLSRIGDFLAGLLLGIATTSLFLLVLLGILCLPILWAAVQEASGLPEPAPLPIRGETPLTAPPDARTLV